MKTSRRRKGLSKLLSPLSEKEFLAKYWPDRRFVVHGSLRRMPNLEKDPLFPNIFVTLKKISKLRTPIRVKVFGKNKQGHLIQELVTPEEAGLLYKSGKWTVVIDGVHLLSRAVQKILNEVARDLPVPFQSFGCNLYASPRGITSPLHFDEQEIFLLQLRGQKKWRIARNNWIKYPTEPYTGGKIKSAELKVLCPKLNGESVRYDEEITLKSGSVLFLPRGYWHSAVTLEDSMALTLTYPSLTKVDVIIQTLRRHLIADEKWRSLASELKDDVLQENFAKIFLGPLLSQF